MANGSSEKAPTWFNVVAIVALIWNVLGCLAFYVQVTLTDEAIAMLPEAEQALYASYPPWAVTAFALAVFGGAVGSLLLLLKKRIARPVLILSLAGVFIQMGHSFFIAKSYEVYGPGAMAMPILVIVVAIYLVALSRKAIKSGWIS